MAVLEEKTGFLRGAVVLDISHAVAQARLPSVWSTAGIAPRVPLTAASRVAALTPTAVVGLPPFPPSPVAVLACDESMIRRQPPLPLFIPAVAPTSRGWWSRC